MRDYVRRGECDADRKEGLCEVKRERRRGDGNATVKGSEKKDPRKMT